MIYFLKSQSINQSHNSIKSNNIIRINLPEKVKEMSSENSRHWGTKLKKTEINGKVVHVHELEELLFFIYHYYEKPYIDSVQSQSRFQWHYFTDVGKNTPPNNLE